VTSADVNGSDVVMRAGYAARRPSETEISVNRS